LGLYSPQVLKLIDWASAITISQSVAYSGYMYMMVMYQRNTGSDPTFLRYFWLCFNVAFSLTHVVLSVIGSSINNLFWYGISEVCLAVQVLVIIVVLNVTLSRLSGYLRQLTQEKQAVGATATNFAPALERCFG